MKVAWTDMSDEIKEFDKSNQYEKLETEYLDNNLKRWSFFKDKKDKEPIAVFESYFNMDYFK